MSFTKEILRAWAGGPLPDVHLFVEPAARPQGLFPLLRLYTRKWLVHPIKRRVARLWLFILRNLFGTRVIAITGSAGKTTAKEMMNSILSQRGKTLATRANIDPVFNIPSTILRAGPKAQFIILEFGIEFPGEMDFYLWLAKPDAAVLTSIAWTHTEFFGNIGGVAREKTKLVAAVGKNGLVVLNRDDGRVRETAKKTAARVVFYGLDSQADVRAAKPALTRKLTTRFTLETPDGQTSVDLPILGRQNVSNALAAASVGWAYGASFAQIKKGLENFSRPPQRMKVYQTKSGAIVLDDSYNSNPLAAKEALFTLAEVPRRLRMAILGDMKELGKHEVAGHTEVGREAGRLGIDLVVGFGKLTVPLLAAAKKEGVGQTYQAKSVKEAASFIGPRLGAQTVVLVKGSRAMKMEKIVRLLLKYH